LINYACYSGGKSKKTGIEEKGLLISATEMKGERPESATRAGQGFKLRDNEHNQRY
jgi:hypothetical protein